MSQGADHVRASNSRWRLHLSTCVLLLLAAAAVVIVGVTGECVRSTGNVKTGELIWLLSPPSYRMEHGWPFVFLRREFSRDTNALPHSGVPWLQRSAWSSEGNDTNHFEPTSRGMVGWRPLLLALDACVLIAILIAMAIALEWRRRRRRIWQFSLAEFLCTTAVVCLAIGWWTVQSRRFVAEQRFGQEQLAGDFHTKYIGPTWLGRAVGRGNLWPLHTTQAATLRQDSTQHAAELAELMPEVETLWIWGPISDRDLASIASLKNLTRLSLQSAITTDEGIAHLKNTKSLESLMISSPLVTDAGLAHLQHLTGLRELSLHYASGLTGEALRELTGLHRLTNLGFTNTHLDHRSLEYISRLENLEHLSINTESFDGRGLEHLTKLKHLKSLLLRNTGIPRSYLTPLLGCESLDYVQWNRHGMNGKKELEQFVQSDQ